MSITTKQGDTGRTRLIFGHEVGKDHPVIAAVGEVDELSAVLGMARLHVKRVDLRDWLALVQADAVGLMGQIAASVDAADRYARSGLRRVVESTVARLTTQGLTLEAEFPDGFHTWSVTGESGDAGSAWLELARTVCRRAERALAVLSASGAAIDTAVMSWLNRLSDVLWLAARAEEKANASP